MVEFREKGSELRTEGAVEVGWKAVLTRRLV